MSVGDVNSTERGSGARYNDGKPDLSLIPLALIAATVPPGPAEDSAQRNEQNAVRHALGQLAFFQTTGWVPALDTALTILSPYWEDCARVFDYGKQKKYAAWNWAKGMAWSIPLACAGRHALAILRGESIDNPEEPNNGSGLRHIGHFMCNVVMLRTFVETFKEGNDLPPPSLFKPAEAQPDTSGLEVTEMPPQEPEPCSCDRCRASVGLPPNCN